LDERYQADYVKYIIHLIVATIVYITIPDADAILGKDSEEYRCWADAMRKLNMTRKQRKEFQRRERVINESNRTYLGRSIKIIDRHVPDGEEVSESDGEKRRSPRMHWRKGHFHGYWVKEGEDKKLITKWVKPTIISSPGAGPMVESRTGMR